MGVSMIVYFGVELMKLLFYCKLLLLGDKML